MWVRPPSATVWATISGRAGAKRVASWARSSLGRFVICSGSSTPFDQPLVDLVGPVPRLVELGHQRLEPVTVERVRVEDARRGVSGHGRGHRGARRGGGRDGVERR